MLKKICEEALGTIEVFRRLPSPHQGSRLRRHGDKTQRPLTATRKYENTTMRRQGLVFLNSEKGNGGLTTQYRNRMRPSCRHPQNRVYSFAQASVTASLALPHCARVLPPRSSGVPLLVRASSVAVSTRCSWVLAS